MRRALSFGRIAVVDAAAYRLSMQLRRNTVGAAGEAASLQFVAVCLAGEIAAEPSEDSSVMPVTNCLSYRRRPKKIHGFSPHKRPRLLVRRAGHLDGERDRLIMAQERDDLVYLAKLAEQAERFDEMVERRRWTHIRRGAA